MDVNAFVRRTCLDVSSVLVCIGENYTKTLVWMKIILLSMAAQEGARVMGCAQALTAPSAVF